VTGRARDDAGGASVEFALVLPALVLLLAVVVGAAGVATTAVRVADASAVVARQVARGDAASAPATLAELVPGATMTTVGVGEFVCVEVTVDARLAGPGTTVPVTSRGCAPRAGR